MRGINICLKMREAHRTVLKSHSIFAENCKLIETMIPVKGWHLQFYILVIEAKRFNCGIRYSHKIRNLQ